MAYILKPVSIVSIVYTVQNFAKKQTTVMAHRDGFRSTSADGALPRKWLQ